MDADGVLAEAVEVFRRSAARSRSTDAPADGDMAGGTDGGRAGSAGRDGASGDMGGDMDGARGDMDIEDLTHGELEDLIAGGGRLPSDAAGKEGKDGSDDVGDAGSGGAGSQGEGEQAGGPWHRPGAAGSGRAPTSEEVYGDIGAAAGKPGSGGGGTATAAERHAELERVLAEAMGDFDGRILDERAVIIAQRGNQPGSVDGPDSAQGGGEGEGRGASGTGRDQAGRRPAPAPPPPGSPQTGTASSGGSVGGGAAPTQTAEADVPIPDDVGDGANDDVVARQLREAAMNETDPELREKLWDEYRRYVSGRR